MRCKFVRTGKHRSDFAKYKVEPGKDAPEITCSRRLCANRAFTDRPAESVKNGTCKHPAIFALGEVVAAVIHILKHWPAARRMMRRCGLVVDGYCPRCERRRRKLNRWSIAVPGWMVGPVTQRLWTWVPVARVLAAIVALAPTPQAPDKSTIEPEALPSDEFCRLTRAVKLTLAESTCTPKEKMRVLALAGIEPRREITAEKMAARAAGRPMVETITPPTGQSPLG